MERVGCSVFERLPEAPTAPAELQVAIAGHNAAFDVVCPHLR